MAQKTWGENGVRLLLICPLARARRRYLRTSFWRENYLHSNFEMASYRETRNLLLLANAENIIDDDELLLLFDLNKSKNPESPYWSYATFDLEEMSDDECKTEFQFLKNDIYNLADVL